MKIVKNKSIYILKVIKKELQIVSYSTGKSGNEECEFGQYSNSLIPHFFSSAFFSFTIFSSLKVAVFEIFKDTSGSSANVYLRTTSIFRRFECENRTWSHIFFNILFWSVL